MAISTIAVPVLNYSFGILNWKLSDIKKIDRKTRKLLTMYNIHNPNADVDRLYITRDKGGRGLMNIEQTYKLNIIGLAKYISDKDNDYLIKSLKNYEINKDSDRTILKVAAIYKTECGIIGGISVDNSRNTLEEIKVLKRKCKEKIEKLREEKWML